MFKKTWNVAEFVGNMSFSATFSAHIRFTIPWNVDGHTQYFQSADGVTAV